MKTGVTISAVGHAALLLWGLISFAAEPYAAKTHEMPIDIISTAEFSRIMAGVRTAPAVAAPKPLVEKVDAPKPIEDVTAKVVETKEIKAATDAAPPPAPEPKPAEPRPPAAAEQKKAEPKRDLIAEALRKEDPKKAEPKKSDPKKAEAKKTEAKKAEPKAAPKTAAQPKFDARQVEALLDRRTPQRLAAAGAAPNPIAGLGAPGGKEAELSQSELDALRRRLSECWSPPAGAVDAGRLQVVIRVQFKPDGTVARPPDLVAAPVSQFGPAMVESAKRALLQCQPYTMLKPEHYEQWKDMEILFDPLTMLRG